jgi:hypothetical protein
VGDGERDEFAIEEVRRETVRPEKTPVAPHVKAPPEIPMAAPAAPTGPRATSDTSERTREWVERFIKPDEPRFGSLLIAASQSAAGTDPPVAAEDSVPVGVRSAGSSGGGTRPRKRRSIWDRRHALRHGYRHRIPKWLTAGGMLAVAAVVVIVVGARMRHSWDASPMDRNAEPKWPAAVSPTSLEPEPASQPASSSAPAPSKTASSPTTPRKATSSTPAPSAVAAASPVRESATSEAAPARAATPDAATPPLATPPTSSRFAINVGSYLSEERARDERDRLVYETGLQGWVIPVSTDGYPSYQVVLGIYGTQERAEQSAEVLITRDLVSEAQVIPLPSRSQRVASP